MTLLRYLHFSILFYFFQPCLPPRVHPPRAPTDINVYREDPDKEIEGALQAALVQIFGVEVSAKSAILVPRHLGVVCIYVQKHSRATPCARMLVGGNPKRVLATPPLMYPLVWGMWGNISCETNVGSECEAAPPGAR